ncbi:hypothetical protein JL720_16160 [Aureococcus anophagefferens]|nr:hypothetical protein JL720_16160 [Aureococcus anophagefferens]
MALRKAWLELPDEPAVGWRVVDVVAEDGAFASVRDGASSTPGVDSGSATRRDDEDEALCSDVSRLASLHAAPLVSALARRFRARTTYTNVGDVLIAVNPWRDVPDAPGAPHVRDVATAALEGAVERRASQAIVISGESGAGKTVSARIIGRRCAGAGTDATVSVTYEPTEQLRVVDALAKALYAALFGSFVAAANAALAAPLEEAGPREAFVGILDIYGFEIFAVNGLDQLLINYANEVLQRSFDDCLLKAEAKHDDDAVPWDAVDLARCLGSTKVADKAHKDCDVYGKPRFDRDKQGGKRVRHAHLQRLLSRPFPTRFG